MVLNGRQKGHLFTNENHNKKAECCFVQHLLGQYVTQNSAPLRMSANDLERAAGTDLEVTNHFYGISEFTDMERTNNED